MISPYVSSFTSGLGGQAVQQSLTQGVTGSASGFALETGFSLLNGEIWMLPYKPVDGVLCGVLG